MRKITVGSFAVLGSVLTMAGLAKSQTAETEIAGTWSVTSTATGTRTCNTRTVAVQSYAWIVSTPSEGEVSVTVQGQTSFPLLTGTSSGARWTLQGPSSAGAATSWFSLTIRGGELSGTRRFLDIENGRPCFVDFTVRGHRT